MISLGDALEGVYNKAITEADNTSNSKSKSKSEYKFIPHELPSTDSTLIYIAIPLIFISIFGNIAAITTIGNKDNWNENTKNMIITLSILTFGVIFYTIFICWYFNKNPNSNMYLIAANSLALFLSILAISFATINS